MFSGDASELFWPFVAKYQLNTFVDTTNPVMMLFLKHYTLYTMAATFVQTACKLQGSAEMLLSICNHMHLKCEILKVKMSG